MSDTCTSNQLEVEAAVRQILKAIGEDPAREGLEQTPARIGRAYNELFGGYRVNPASIFTTFDGEGYNGIVLLKDVELYSMCEHHMLPFVGKAHVAYIPDERVVGVSKLARLVDVFARRLQIQERLGQQVTATLVEHLQPKGAACIIEAVHYCMRMRGCSKQMSTMVTSSMDGVFLGDDTFSLAARNELMALIRG